MAAARGDLCARHRWAKCGGCEPNTAVPVAECCRRHHRGHGTPGSNPNRASIRLTNPNAPSPPTKPEPEALHTTLAQNERDRVVRVLDPKVRTIGIDKQVLDRQVEERAHRDLLAAQAEEWEDKKRVQQDMHAAALADEARAAQRAAAADVEQYRRTYQRRGLAREHDLNDPDARRRDVPARVGDDDPRCGAASMQKFEGEDLGAGRRRERQREQVRGWTEQQREAREAQRRREEEEAEADLQRQGAQDALVGRQAQLAAAQHRERRQTVAEYNRAAAAAKQREAADAAAREQQQDLEDIQNALCSDLLTEGGEHANRRDRMKGFGTDAMQDLRAAQAAQMQEARARRVEEAERERAAAAAAEQERVRGAMLEQQVAGEKAAARAGVARANVVQALRRKTEDATRNRLYAPELGEQYFRPMAAKAR